MQRALALAFRARLDFPHPPLNRANEERDLAERKILSPRKNKPPFSLPRTLARLSIVLPFPQPPPVRFLFHPGHNAKIARRLLHCPLPPPYSPHRRYKTCKIEKTPAFQCLYYMYTRTCTWARVCGWRPRVNGYGTHWGEGRGRREVRGAEDTLGERSIVIPTDPSFQHSSLAQQAGYTVTTMTTMTMVTMMSMTNVESPLSLSLFLFLSSPLVVVDTMVKSRGRSRRFLLSFPVAVRCVWSRSSKIILDRSLLSKTGGSSFARFEGRLYLAEIFFREREI